MKKRRKISPGQLSVFGQIEYADRNYSSLKDAMISAMQDFYIKKIYPAKIIAFGVVYDLKEMKKYWELYGFHDVYVC